MIYYPLSQIKPNLYTNGKEYALVSTGEAYKGYYYALSNGKKYTGKKPKDFPNLLLTLLSPESPLLNNPNVPTKPKSILTLNSIQEGLSIESNYQDNFRINTTYSQINKPLPLRFIPLFNSPSPTQKELNLGQFNRYFCKKTNELKYLEIDKETYDQLKAKDSKIAWDLYEPASLLWVIKGNQEKVFNTNKTSVFKIEQNQRWNGFSQYFKENYSKYYLGS